MLLRAWKQLQDLQTQGGPKGVRSCRECYQPIYASDSLHMAMVVCCNVLRTRAPRLSRQRSDDHCGMPRVCCTGVGGSAGASLICMLQHVLGGCTLLPHLVRSVEPTTMPAQMAAAYKNSVQMQSHLSSAVSK